MARGKRVHRMTPTRPNKRIIGALSLLSAGSLLLGACSSTPAKKSAKKTTTTTTAAPKPVCPLTGVAPTTGSVPQRPAVAVKVDNYVDARPQSGLDKTDLVFEEPVEGGITRYVAVFQCQDAAQVGPIRSARQIDIGILGQLGNPGLAHVGGINPVLNNITAAGIPNLDLGNYGQVITHLPGRYAPYNTYTSTGQLYGIAPKSTTPPKPIYSYSQSPRAGATAINSVHIPFSGNSDVTWNWSAPQNAFLRFYNGTQPDNNADGVQNSAANVIVQTVNVTYGPWLENSEGGLEVQAVLSGTSGPATVFRNGVEIPGTWSRASNSSPTVFTGTNGKPISMAPGRTWIELVPASITVTPTIPASATTPGA